MRTFIILLACLFHVSHARRKRVDYSERHESTDAFAGLLFAKIPSMVRFPANLPQRRTLMTASDRQRLRGSDAVLSTRRAIAKTILAGVAVALPALTPAASHADDILEIAGSFVSLLKPLYSLEAPLQAGNYDKAAVRTRIENEISTNPVVVYSYTLSPFCTEAKTLLREAVKASRPDSSDEIKVIELGDEWLPGMLPADGAAIRAELGAMTGQTSMPHIFIGGKSIGGLATGTPGLKPLIKSGQLQQKVNDATWQTVGASGGAVL